MKTRIATVFGYLLVIITLVYFFAPRTPRNKGDFDSLTRDFERRKPVEEATKDYRSGNFHIYSCMGIGRYYPGLTHDEGARLAGDYGLIEIHYTSDVIEDSNHADYISAAVNFAEEYNRHMRDLLVADDA